jgi:hypothetical protein
MACKSDLGSVQNSGGQRVICVLRRPGSWENVSNYQRPRKTRYKIPGWMS